MGLTILVYFIKAKSETTKKTIDSSRVILELLNKLTAAVQEVGRLQAEQDKVISTTISMNESIVNNISMESEQFKNIADLAGNNASEIQTLTAQVEILGHLVKELNVLLEE